MENYQQFHDGFFEGLWTPEKGIIHVYLSTLVKGILANITSTANKAVDYVAVDLKGASKSQVNTIKDFVKTLTKKQQGKIVYVK